MLQTLWDNFKKADQIYEQKLKGRFMNVIIANMWKRRRNRWGGDVFIINTNLVRRNLSFYAYTQHDARYQRALETIKPFLLGNFEVENIRMTVRKFYHDISFIQRKIRD